MAVILTQLRANRRSAVVSSSVEGSQKLAVNAMSSIGLLAIIVALDRDLAVVGYSRLTG